MSEEMKSETDNIQEQSNEDFDVIFVSKADDGTVVATTPLSIRDQKLQLALSQYDPENKKYSVYLNEGISPSKSISVEEIEELSTNTQNDLNKVLRINAYNRKLINKNDIVGKTVESIDTNINTEIKLTYGNVDEGRNKKKKLEECKRFIKDFNTSIKVQQLTRNAITTSYVEGNWISYLRHEDKDNYTVDIYPLGVCEITETMINGEPVIWFNIKELRKRLQKVYRKTKKKKPLMFENMEEEVKNSYPKEVYEAFINKEDYAVLDNKYTGIIRINNLNRKYGVSPILRAYTDLSMLDTFADSDRINSKAKAKKIIHQKMRKETMGQDYNKDFVPEMSYAHANFMDAFKQNTVVVTSPPTVEEISYVEPKVEMTSKDTYNIYRSKVLSTLGIQFLMDSGSQSVSTASISVTQLMRTINAISEQLEDILKKWYRQIILDNGYTLDYTPDVNVIDTEQLEAELKHSLAILLFSTMNCSYATAFEILGLDINDEVQKRTMENEKKYDEIFKPHGSQYTNSEKQNPEDNKGGRPADSNNKVKQQYDKTRQEAL
jgi:predicted HTH domain antitoxin